MNAVGDQRGEAAMASADTADRVAELEALSASIDPLTDAGDVDGLEAVVQRAAEIAEETKGRTRRHARHIRDGAKNALADVRRLQDTVDVTPISFAIALLGGALMLVAVFLPQLEAPTTFAQIEKNTLIQNGDGWWFVVLALAIAGTAWRAYNRKYRTPAPAISGVIAIGIALYYGVDHSQLRLCSTTPRLLSHCVQGTPGIGIYAAGVGGFLAVVGGWQMFRASPLVYESDEETIYEALESADVPTSSGALAERLRVLENLHRQGLVTTSEYEQRRASLLDEI